MKEQLEQLLTDLKQQQDQFRKLMDTVPYGVARYTYKAKLESLNSVELQLQQLLNSVNITEGITMTNGSDLIHADKQTFGSKELGGGLTKREFFATQALVGLVQRTQYRDRELIEMPSIADAAVKFADALIEALNKKEK